MPQGSVRRLRDSHPPASRRHSSSNLKHRNGDRPLVHHRAALSRLRATPHRSAQFLSESPCGGDIIFLLNTPKSRPRRRRGFVIILLRSKFANDLKSLGRELCPLIVSDVATH